MPASSSSPTDRQVYVNPQSIPYRGQAPTQVSMAARQVNPRRRAMLNPNPKSSARVFDWITYRHANKGKLLPVFSLNKPSLRTQPRSNIMVEPWVLSTYNVPVRGMRPGILVNTSSSTDIHAHAASTQLQAITLQPLNTLLNIHTYQNTHAQNARSLFSSPPCCLDTLPAEIRVRIYGYVFAGATLEASKSNMDRCNINDQFSPYRLIVNVCTSIISASRFFLNEALPYLNTATTLEVPRIFGRNDPLANIPDDFMSHVKNITVHIDSFVHIDRRRLSSLQRVHLLHDVDAPGGFEDVIEAMNADGGMEDVIEELFNDVLSWKWKQRQFAFLAAEEGFALRMTVSLSFWCPAPEMAGIDFEMDSTTNTVVRTRGFIGSQEVAVNNADQAKKDWEAYSGL
ncbi:hypothetical protein LTS07_003860 [Exophiala sideris]|uniref:F-box domain-containing protein n=1 Tax=Exophiala sideris TaxID=1016849 RepID=A0ABR0JI53_9EURO|nr:hypothetical protein LTS07_003860 [Exophiala sideris]KAK5064099.1 hypothetical protein LTR69_003868 [Exophiala sideris]